MGVKRVSSVELTGSGRATGRALCGLSSSAASDRLRRSARNGSMSS